LSAGDGPRTARGGVWLVVPLRLHIASWPLHLRKDTKSRAQKQASAWLCRDGVSKASAKVRKVERRSKRQLDYAETEYL